MDKTICRKIGLAFFLFIAISAFALQAPKVCMGEDLDITFEFSPNKINLSSERLGDIRILTGMEYSFYKTNTGEPFIYFNDCEVSIENINASRDSLGNLILRFSLEDLLKCEDYLLRDSFNKAKLVISLKVGSEYIEHIGEGEIYMTDKINSKK